ncbi:hypothetical protein [Nonomuraea sp. NPDC050783]|uniref:hypothetical protein n=1 Tax=Nonomuraea sp. NPDC050783 TaxID=3154634 RepID=UPI0034673BEC
MTVTTRSDQEEEMGNPAQNGNHVERGDSEERSGSPLTEAEEETSRRPAGQPAPDDDDDDQDTQEFLRSENLNPDDFE